MGLAYKYVKGDVFIPVDFVPADWQRGERVPGGHPRLWASDGFLGCGLLRGGEPIGVFSREALQQLRLVDRRRGPVGPVIVTDGGLERVRPLALAPGAALGSFAP